MIARKHAETDAQIQALRHHVLEQCVAINSSIETIPAGIVPSAMRGRWRHELQQAAHAVPLVEERFAHEPRAEA